MISQEQVQKLASQYKTSEFPNIVREYFQHLFLVELYKIQGSENLLFKGGTALRIVYGSPRFSEDLDFSLFRVAPHEKQKFVEDIFNDVLAAIEKVGIRVEIGQSPGVTREGYYGDATFRIQEYQPISVVINISSRNGRNISGEIDSIPNDFIPTYNLYHLPQRDLVEEKVFSALMSRKKARDFYDLYFIMRKGLLDTDQKKRLAGVKNIILENSQKVDFKEELGVFLPVDQQEIIRDFPRILAAELNRQLAPA